MTTADPAAVRIDVLGPIELWVGGRPVPVTSARLRHLLAVLAGHANAVVSVDRLVDIIWPDEAGSAAVRTLRTNIWRLRNLLGPEAEDLVATRPGGYLLSLADGGLDADRFERSVAEGSALLHHGDATGARALFERGLAMWRGRAFEGFETTDWARPITVRLEALRWSASERRIETLLATGDVDMAIADVNALIEQDPLRERLCELSMRALYQSHRQPDALQAFAAYRSLLAEELGVEPSPALRRLEQAMLAHDFSETDQPIPSRVARGYQLHDAVASTTVSVTYRATSPQSAAPVLLTVVDRSVACDAAYVRAFELGSQRLRSVTHPSLLPVVDCWRDADGAYFASPLRAVPSPGERWTAPSRAVFVRVANDVVGAVRELHGAGLVHGRLGEGTISVDDDGDVLVSPGGLVSGSLRASQANDVSDLARWLTTIAPGDLPSVVVEALATLDESDISAVAAVLGTEQAHVDVGNDEGTRNPYVGIRAFQEADAEVFFGRQALVKSMLAQLSPESRNDRFLAVVGPSGSGKSSVVRAGLLPAVRAGALSGSMEWFVTTMTPGPRPFSAFVQSLDAVALRPIEGVDRLRSAGGDVLGRCAAAVLPAGSTLLVVIDQLEELFIEVDEPARASFIDMIVAAVRRDRSDPRDASCDVRIVATLRADFYDSPMRYPDFGRLIDASQVVVTSPDGAEIAEAILGPADVAGLTIEPGLVRAVASDYALNPVPPLLQHALAEVADRRSGRVLTLDAYDEIGGLAGGLAHRAEAIFAECNPEERSLVRTLFTRLVTPGVGTADTRRRVLRRELVGLPGGPGSVDGVLERFGSARLVSFDHERNSREPTVEIAHEALIGGWGRLAAWIDEDRDGLRDVRHLIESARGWQERGRDSGDLYRGLRLESALTRSEQRPGELGAAESEFLAASDRRRRDDDAERAARAQTQERQHHRLRRMFRIAVVAAASALVAGAVAGVQARRADRGRSAANEARAGAVRQAAVAEAAKTDADRSRIRSDIDRLVAQAISDAGDTPARAMLLAAAAYDLEQSPATAGALQATITAQPPGFLGFIPSGETAEVELGAGVLVRHAGDRVEIIDRAERVVLRTIPDATTNARVALSVQDRYLALAGPEVRIYDVADARMVASFSRSSNAIDVDFDPTDPQRVAVGFDDGTTEVVSWSTGATVASVAAQGDFVLEVAFSPDGRHLATTTGNRESAIRLWDATNGQPVTANLGTPGSSITHDDLTFDRTGTRIASVDRGGVGRVWSVPSGELISKTVNTYGFEQLNSLEFVEDGVIAAAGPAGLLRRWSAATGVDLGVTEPHAGLVASLALDPDRRVLVVGGNLHLALFDLRSSSPGHEVEAFPTEIRSVLPRGAPINGSITGDARTVALVAGGQVWLWDRNAGAAGVRKVPAPPGAGLPISATLSDDGSRLVVPWFGPASTAVTVIDTSSLALVRSIPAVRGQIVAISPDNRWLAMSGISFRRLPTLDVVDLTDGVVHRLINDLESITDDVDPIRGSWVSTLAFSPSSDRIVAVNHCGAALVWDTSTMKPSGPPLARGGNAILDARFAPSGRTLVTVDGSNVISMIDIDSRQPIGSPFETASGLSLGPVMSGDGSRMLSGGSDGVQLWDVGVRRSIGKPYPIPAANGSTPMRWLADGERFSTVTDRGVETWTTEPSEWRAHACQLAGRTLSSEERTQFGITMSASIC